MVSVFVIPVSWHPPTGFLLVASFPSSRTEGLLSAIFDAMIGYPTELQRSPKFPEMGSCDRAQIAQSNRSWGPPAQTGWAHPSGKLGVERDQQNNSSLFDWGSVVTYCSWTDDRGGNRKGDELAVDVPFGVQQKMWASMSSSRLRWVGLMYWY